MQPLMNVIGNLGYVAVCVIGAALVSGWADHLWRNHGIYHVCPLVYLPAQHTGTGYDADADGSCRRNRIFDFLQEEELSDESYKTEIDRGAWRGRIRPCSLQLSG